MFVKQNSRFSWLKSITSLAILITTIFISDSVSAHTASITTSGTINLDVSASGNGANVVTDDIVINSSCPLGYTVSIKGMSDNTLYKDGDSTNNTNTTKINASTGTKTNPVSILGNNINTWGYNLGNNITASSDFIGLTNTASVLTTSTTASATGGDTISLTYGASVDHIIEPGDYKLAESTSGAGDNVITYILTTNPACDTYKIRYNDNGANSTTTMGDQTVATNSDLTFWASNFKRQGYGFAGWNTKADGTGTSYGPNQTIPQADLQSFLDNNTTIVDGGQYVNLYAIWVQSQGNLQNWSGCSSMNIGDITALTDQRDNNTYAVAKLADNKCWMIENLRLDNTNSDNATGNLAQGYNTATFKGLADPETPPNTFTTTNPNSLYSTDGANNTFAITGSNQSYRFPRYNNVNTSNTVTNMTTPSNANIYSYGNYYTWPAAIADTTDYTTNGQTISNTSICPKGWHLPTGNTGGEFSSLDSSMGGTGNYQSTTEASNRWRSYPNNFVYSGLVYSSSVSTRGSLGYYWSSTVYNNGSAYSLYFDSSGVYPGTNVSKYSGFMARCIAPTSYTIEFNANGGSGTMNSQSVDVGATVNLNANTFTAPKKQFVNWNTKADGTGTSYTDSQSITDLVGLNESITLYAQWGCPANSICYDDNGANSPTKMGNQSITSTDAETTLWASNFQRSGYGFAGWNTKADGTGTNYGPNQTISFTAGQYSNTGSGLDLYAIWVESVGNLQNWSGCSSMNIGDITALTDQRDSNTYAVAKLKDNKCWMIENLRLDNTNSDNATGDLAQGYNTSTFKGLADPETPPNTFFTTNPNSLYSTDGANNTFAITGNNQSLRFPRYDNTNTSNTVTNMTTGDANIYSYGNYYTWPAAIADTTNYTTNGQTISNTSICPKGWHLPTGNTDGEFSSLDSSMGGTGDYQSTAEASNRWRSYPNNFIYSSYVDGSSVAYRGLDGYYWSSTVYNNGGAYRLSFVSNNVYPGTNNNGKYYGFMARCVAGS